jgi:N-acetylneuraminate synthase/sialic acid synthase
MGKSLVAAARLPAGHRLSREDIAIKSPGGGVPPFELDRMLGQLLRRAVDEDEFLAFEDLSD